MTTALLCELPSPVSSNTATAIKVRAEHSTTATHPADRYHHHRSARMYHSTTCSLRRVYYEATTPPRAIVHLCTASYAIWVDQHSRVRQCSEYCNERKVRTGSTILHVDNEIVASGSLTWYLLFASSMPTTTPAQPFRAGRSRRPTTSTASFCKQFSCFTCSDVRRM